MAPANATTCWVCLSRAWPAYTQQHIVAQLATTRPQRPAGLGASSRKVQITNSSSPNRRFGPGEKLRRGLFPHERSEKAVVNQHDSIDSEQRGGTNFNKVDSRRRDAALSFLPIHYKWSIQKMRISELCLAQNWGLGVTKVLQHLNSMPRSRARRRTGRCLIDPRGGSGLCAPWPDRISSMVQPGPLKYLAAEVMVNECWLYARNHVQHHSYRFGIMPPRT